MREEVEGLKDHAGPQTQLALLFALIARSWRMAAGDCHVADGDGSRIGDFELIQAAQKSAFAATARANDHDSFTGLLRMVHAIQDASRAERFDELLNDDHSAAFVRANWRKAKLDSLV